MACHNEILCLLHYKCHLLLLLITSLPLSLKGHIKGSFLPQRKYSKKCLLKVKVSTQSINANAGGVPNHRVLINSQSTNKIIPHLMNRHREESLDGRCDNEKV